MENAASFALRYLIRLYQLALSPLLGARCRFTPACSHYAMEAIERHGAARGVRLTLKRLLRCHPWGGSGYDPVPSPAILSIAKDPLSRRAAEILRCAQNDDTHFAP